MQNSETTNGQSVMASLGQKVKSLFLGGKKKEKTWEDKLQVLEKGPNEFYIQWENGTPFAGPYSRRQDAKSQITRLKKTYTPGIRGRSSV